jgi:4-hydroxy-tetrahydrodipicolinate synthase
MFTGTYTALVSPFRNGEIDEKAFEDLIEAQIAAGVDGIVPVGTTGESPTVDLDEHVRLIDLAVRFAKGRVKVIAGTGSNSTKEAIWQSEQAAAKGADGLLLVNPYYNKPSQEGLFRHFQAMAKAVALPIMLYSIPARTGGEISLETVVRLATEVPNIVSLKEAGGSVDRTSQLCAAVPEGFTVLSGDDSLTLPFLSVGAVGVVSVASNVIPEGVCKLVAAYRSGRTDEALALHRLYSPLFKNLFIEPNPVPSKTALEWMGKMTSEVRLPLCEMAPATSQILRETLQKLQLVS